MRGVLMFAAASALLPVAACISEAASSGSERPMGEMADARYGRLAGENVRRISGADLRDLVSGSSISRHAPPPGDPVIISVPTIEIFQADGTYIRVVENVRAFGRYLITQNRVCSTLSGQGRCRLFFRGVSGGYYMVFVDSPQSIMRITLAQR